MRRKAAVRAWVASARADLVAAQVLSEADRESIDPSTVAFHAQQCVEKALKAWLMELAIDFRPTHDLNVLLNLLPSEVSDRLDPGIRRLTPYAVAMRYPSPSGDPMALIAGPDWPEADQAVGLAFRTMQLVCAAVLEVDEAGPIG
ncbi:MAG: HEPN domain-containing protein [Chloroflexota bacterium]